MAKRILLADGEKLILKYNALGLSQQDYSVGTTTLALDAIAAAQIGETDIIVLDTTTDVKGCRVDIKHYKDFISGDTQAHTVLRNALWTHDQIRDVYEEQYVIFTGAMIPDHVQAYLGETGTQTLLKPYSVQELVEVIAKLG